MSSYCEVCCGLFDMPHEHCQFSCRSRQDTPQVSCSTTFPLRGAASFSPTHMCRRKSSSCRSSPASAPGWCGSGSRERKSSAYRWPSVSSSHVSPATARKRTAPQRRTPSMPTTAGAERDTVCSLLRMGPSAWATALVHTPTFDKKSPSSRRHVRGERRFFTSPSKKDAQSSGTGKAPGARVARRLDTLQRTLERIREAVRLDNKAALDAAGETAKRNYPASVHVESGEGILPESWHPENRGSNEDVGAVDDTLEQQDLCGSAGDVTGGMSIVDQRNNVLLGRQYSFSTTQSSPIPQNADCGVMEPLSMGFKEDVSPLPPSSSSYDKRFLSPEGHFSVVLPASRPKRFKVTNVASLSAGTQTLEPQTPTSPEGELVHSSLSRSERVRSDTVMAHLEALREGFVELCGAVREDLHALHVRVNELQKRQEEQEQQRQQQCQPPQQVVSGDVSCERVTGKLSEKDATGMRSSMSHDMLLAELRQYTLSTVHKVFKEYQQQQRAEHTTGLRSAAPEVPDLVPVCSPSSPPFSTWGLPPTLTPNMCGLSPEAFNAHLRSTVCAVLREGDFRREVEVIAEQQVRGRGIKTWRREWKRRCSEFEEQLTTLAETVESTRLDVEELRLRSVLPPPPPPPPPPSPPQATLPTAVMCGPTSHSLSAMPALSGAGHPVGLRAATVANARPEVCEDRLMQRVQRLFADAEERWMQSVRAEVVQPLLEHVRKLMSVHQSMIDTVVEGRCAQFEAYVDRSRQGWELQVAELRSRVSSLRGDVHRALMNLSENLNVACPGL